jgi:signal transduction histidine kinase
VVSEAVYVALVSCSSVFALAVAGWLLDDERGLTARLFVGVALLNGLAGLLVLGEVLAPTRSLAIGLYGAHAGVGSGVSVFTFLFAVAYVGHRRWLTRGVLTGVLGAWAAYGVVQITNPLHGLVWSEYTFTGSQIGYVEGIPTPLSMVLFVPQSLLYPAAMVLLGAHVFFGPRTRRRQTAVLFVALIAPFFVLFAWFGGLIPGPFTGALVAGSTWTLGLAGWVVFRHEAFELAPLARDTVFEALDEMVVVIDGQRRVLDYNDTAADTFPAVARGEGDPVETAIPQLLSGGQPVDSDVRDGDDSSDGPDPARDDTAGAGGVTASRAEAAVETADSAEPTDESTVDLVAERPDEVPFVESFTRYVGETLREYSVTVTPLSVRGAVEGYALVLRDVTERRRHVRDLEQQTAQLERLASTLSHDLRNPLNVAHGRVELARQGGDTDNLVKASEALDRMEQIIDDSLTLAREGQTIDERERVDLATVARRAWETTDTGGATLEVDPEVAIGVYSDPSRLQSVFENLFRNAVEHGTELPETSPEPGTASAEPEQPASPDAGTDAGTGPEQALARGGADASESEAESGDGGAGEANQNTDAVARQLTVRLGRHADGFYVEDDGPGVPPDERDAVFDYEFSTDEDGTGLGLAIVEAIARAHGWSVEMTEGSDGGARVVFSGVDVADTANAAD